MKIKHPFALLVPLLFLLLVSVSACKDANITGLIEVEVKIPCVGPPPIIDSLAGAEYNGACPYRMWWNDTLRTFQPGTAG